MDNINSESSIKNKTPLSEIKTSDYTEKILTIDDKNYNSAGVLIINKYLNKDCIVFFKSSKPIPSGVNKGKFYCDIPGGGIDIKDESLEETASRELYEESKKLLSISKNNLEMMKQNNSFFELPGRRLSGKRKVGLFGCFVCKARRFGRRPYKHFENDLIFHIYDMLSL
jgi:hypothetical protein